MEFETKSGIIKVTKVKDTKLVDNIKLESILHTYIHHSEENHSRFGDICVPVSIENIDEKKVVCYPNYYNKAHVELYLWISKEDFKHFTPEWAEEDMEELEIETYENMMYYIKKDISIIQAVKNDEVFYVEPEHNKEPVINPVYGYEELTKVLFFYGSIYGLQSIKKMMESEE